MKILSKTIYISVILIIICLSSISAFAQNQSPGYFPPQPKDTEVLISKPQIGMQLILNGNKLSSMEMYINEKKVEAIYDEKKGGVFYTPNYPLTPGMYKVNLKIQIEGFQPINQAWSFTITNKAIDNLPVSNEQQKNVLTYANSYRKRFGLQSFLLNDSLNSAAMSHANYMALNKKVTHVEYAAEPGYTGSKVSNRAAAFGYSNGNVAENVTGDIKDYKEAIDYLIDAPYHRISWLNPSYKYLGYGQKDAYQVFNFGGSTLAEDRLVTYPVNNEHNVKVSWDGNETPNPLRFYETDKEVGYPITISYFSNKTISKWTIQKVTLLDSSGGALNTYINTPTKDENLTDSIIVTPIEKLKYDSRYSVSIKGTIDFTDSTSKTINKTWNFYTMKKPKAIKKESIYPDVTNHWAIDYIDELAKKGILNPKVDNLFKPDFKITRSEFTKFMVKALNVKVGTYEKLFVDVPEDLPDATYIEAAYKVGLINGTGNGKFEPNRSITREEIAVIITKAYEKKKGPINIKTVILPFKDNKKISNWSLSFVKGVFNLRIINGRPNGEFDPQGDTTRAESAVMIKKLLDNLNK